MDSGKAYHPGETLKIRLQTDSPALVALGAVDTALYAVGSKSHKPLNMAKVCQALSLTLPLHSSLSCCPGPRISLVDTPPQSSLEPWPPWPLTPPLSVSLILVRTLPSHLQLSGWSSP